MAIPTGAGNFTSNGVATSTVALTLPGNLVVGDVLLCAIGNKNASATTSFPTGTWTTLQALSGTRSGGLYGINVTSGLLASLGTPGSSSLTVTSGAGGTRLCGALFRATGRDVSSFLDAASGAYVQAAASATWTVPAVTPTKTGSDLVAMGFLNAANVTFTMTPTDGLTQLGYQQFFDGASMSGLWVAYQENATTATVSTGSRTATVSPTPTIAVHGAMAALSPNPVVTPTIVTVGARRRRGIYRTV